MNPIKPMWEILVPTVRNDGRPFRTRYHRVWDKKVRAIANGLTIMKPSKGHWVSDTDVVHEERMIPVRIVCSLDDMKSIAEITKEYYEQEKVLFYKISNETYFV